MIQSKSIVVRCNQVVPMRPALVRVLVVVVSVAIIVGLIPVVIAADTRTSTNDDNDMTLSISSSSSSLSQKQQKQNEKDGVPIESKQHQDQLQQYDEYWNTTERSSYSTTDNIFDMERMLQSDSRYCTIIMNKYVYQTNNSYQERQNACNCFRSSERLVETTDVGANGKNVEYRTLPGAFAVNCLYDYCSNQCGTYDTSATTTRTFNRHHRKLQSSSSGRTVCADLIANSSYTENIKTPSNTELKEEKECVTYYSTDSSNINQKVCKRTYVDYNLETACQIQFGDGYYVENCNSCEFVTCNTNNDLLPQAIAFDCTNIDGLYALNPCNYTEEGDYVTGQFRPDPKIWSFDPLSHYNPEGLIRFDSCYDRNAPSTQGAVNSPQSSSPTPQPSPKPIQPPTPTTSTTTDSKPTSDDNTDIPTAEPTAELIQPTQPTDNNSSSSDSNKEQTTNSNIGNSSGTVPILLQFRRTITLVIGSIILLLYI